MRILVFALGLVVAVLAGPAEAQKRWHGQGGANFDPVTCEPRFCEESGWIYDDVSSDHTTVWRHRMRSTPRFVSILFTPDPDVGPVYPLVWSWQLQNTGNPAGLEVDNRAVRIHIWSGAPMHGVWRPGEGWTKWREGYWKIVVYR